MSNPNEYCPECVSEYVKKHGRIRNKTLIDHLPIVKPGCLCSRHYAIDVLGRDVERYPTINAALWALVVFLFVGCNTTEVRYLDAPTEHADTIPQHPDLDTMPLTSIESQVICEGTRHCYDFGDGVIWCYDRVRAVSGVNDFRPTMESCP